MNWLKEYHKEVDNGNILTSEAIKLQIAREKKFMKLSSDYYYDNEAALDAIEFMETFIEHYQGEKAGQKFKLELWQKWIVSGTFGFKRKSDDYRLVRFINLMVARKNGKTFFGAGIILYMLIADGEMGPQCFSAATTREQASIAYKDVYTVIKNSKSFQKMVDKKMLYKSKTRIDYNPNDGFFMPVSSEANTLDGKNPHCYLLDEVHAWKTGDVEQVLKTGVAARRQPLGVAISSNGVLRGGFFDEKMEYGKKILNGVVKADSEFYYIFELDSPEELHDKKNWIKANPNIGVSVFEDYLETAYNNAKEMPSQAPTILPKNFNIPMNGANYFFDAEEVKVNEFDESLLINSSGFFGADLAMTSDNTCLTYLTSNNGKFYSKSWHLIPDGQIQTKMDKEKIPYKIYSEDNDIMKSDVIILPNRNETTQGDVDDIIMQIVNKFNIKVLKFAFDPYKADNLIEKYRSIGGKEYVIAARNSYRNLLTPAMYRLKSNLANKSIYFNSKLTSIHLINTDVKYHSDETISLQKDGNSSHKIDNVMSLLYAFLALEDFCKNESENINFNSLELFNTNKRFDLSFDDDEDDLDYNISF